MSPYERDVPQMSLIWELINKGFLPLSEAVTINNGAIGIARKNFG
jgi:hypothetical protein